ncbi:hypothetical protein BX616_004169 [Lobosporangium transversale]|uniref:FAD-binding domain-containing protein n=1 Tax=Lobosporangium transversale TaxID=64571 RepID=A0A1Y2GJU3_9FUNG|nr:hypothetical protein BCR41DRAFT_423048 [Lobosporangium transversale]KAF9898331.1 hypothetical protein BX616_004169 [Lobosporangium transversale]ORZ12979.1 hypothetical protein BCR41DRAFT_423048 [Lobosporangium transversale]|eukprot:XP_021880328.1 hypothetical protein BCR41DRAFT_423048 [Lobosporangium transversale]
MPPPKDFKVLIVGAGVGGLMLATLLERAGIDYAIFERASAIKPFGSAMSLGANVFYLFKQLGLLEDLQARAKPYDLPRIYSENSDEFWVRDFSGVKDMAGYPPYVISRPQLYDLLLQGIPPHKLHLQKRVLSIEEKNNGHNSVSITCADQSVYEGSIIVGADGAYSSIRQAMYKILLHKGLLPKADQNSDHLPFTSVCFVGQTRTMNPEKDGKQFRGLSEELSRVDIIEANSQPYTWATFTTRQNTICWMLVQHLDKDDRNSNSSDSDKSKDRKHNLEWRSEAVKMMCEQFKDFLLPNYPGLTLGDLFKITDMDLVSKVMLEEKLFETWYSDRTVLLGDACHKLHPNGGLGAVSAIHDAVALANVLYDLTDIEPNSITQAFRRYREERYPLSKTSYNTSYYMGRILGKSLINAFLRLLLKNMPVFIWQIVLKRMYGYRPQVNFLPYVKDLGSIPPAPQLTLKKVTSDDTQRAE